MKTKVIPITTGAASGTLVTEVRSNKGSLVGYIRVVNIKFPSIGCGQYYAAYFKSRHLVKLCPTLLEAYKTLGIDEKEVDKCVLGPYAFDEKSNKYWRDRRHKVTLPEYIYSEACASSFILECSEEFAKEFLDKQKGLKYKINAIDNGLQAVEILNGELYACGETKRGYDHVDIVWWDED